MLKHLCAATVLTLCVFSTTGSAKTVDARNDMSWLDGFSLVVLETDDAAGLHRARATIQTHGGRVAIMSPPSFILGWVPYELRNELIGKAGIKDIRYTEVLPGEIETTDFQSRTMLRYFNRVARGEIQQERFEELDRAAPQIEWPEGTDVEIPEPFNEPDYLENLERAGLDIDQLRQAGQLMENGPETLLGNSDEMTGTISVTLFFVESDGTIDPNLYSWTQTDMDNYVDGVNTGLAWYTAMASNYFDCWNAFFVYFFPATDARCNQGYEPVTHTSGFTSTWINLVMANFGYTGGSVFSRVNAFNTAQKAANGTDWAYSAFIANNSGGAPDRFTNGTSAFAYLGGPYTVLLLYSYGWPVNQVFTHETGHIFYACDEYIGSCSCSCSGEVHNNCHLCGAAACMMKANTFNLCIWTPNQFGWSGLGCSPSTLTPPTLSSASPASQYQGVGGTMAVVGTDFLWGAAVDMGPDVTIHSTTLVTTESLTVDFTVNNDAPIGFVDVTVTNRDLQTGSITNGFEILATTRHYVAPAGGNVFPYITPANAATLLANAVAAAGDGDSVLVDSTTVNNVALNIFEGVKLLGAWTPDFSSRDVQGSKTTLNLTGNIFLVTGGEPVEIDGFVLQNGTGDLYNTPVVGYYGGAVFSLNAPLTVSNCEVRSCDAATGGNYGLGGAIYARGVAVDIHDNLLTDNGATQGGAIFLDDCTGSVSGNVISANRLAFSAQPAAGGGVYAMNCSTLTLVGNMIDGNLQPPAGTSDGGGVYISNSTDIAVNGGSISDNAAIAGGGAIFVTGTGTFSIAECKVSGNSAAFGGGLNISAVSVFADYNIIVGNTASTFGGGSILSSTTGGSFIGNTVDLNDGSIVGGVSLAGAGLLALNNIITNSTNVGLFCSGPPTIRYNNVWNSGTSDYSGCTGGEGAISADPLFVDAPALDYHLALHSPCIDRGDTTPVYDDPDGSRGDMGRYGSHSFVMDQPSYPKNLSASVVLGDVILEWDANPEPDVVSYAVYKDSTEDFIPGAGNFLQLVAAPDSMVNLGAVADSCFYIVSAVDTADYAGGYSSPDQPDVATAILPNVTYRFGLYQNLPNPFNPMTTIRYEIGKRSHVLLSIFDVRGRLVRKLVNTSQGPGLFSTVWDGRSSTGSQVSSGVYFYKLVAGAFVQTRKMILLK